jgi:predicted nucleotidyltransferase
MRLDKLGFCPPMMDPSSNVDDAVLESILRLSLEEAAHRGERLHGKSRVGASLTTEQYALQLQAAELETALQSIRDARLARNVADAVNDDDIQQLVQLEHLQHENRANSEVSMGDTSSSDVEFNPHLMMESPQQLMPELVPEQDM